MIHTQLGDSGKVDIAVNCGHRRGGQCVWGGTRTRAECKADEDVDDVSGVQTSKRHPDLRIPSPPPIFVFIHTFLDILIKYFVTCHWPGRFKETPYLVTYPRPERRQLPCPPVSWHSSTDVPAWESPRTMQVC